MFTYCGLEVLIDVKQLKLKNYENCINDNKQEKDLWSARAL
jgi:hypothetical protein